MSYRNSCKKCNHAWTSPTEAGAAKTCPVCRTTGSTIIGSAFVEDTKDSESEDELEKESEESQVHEAFTEFDPEIKTPPEVTTQFELTDKATAEVEKPVDFDVSH